MKRNFILLFLVFLALAITPVFSAQSSGKLELIRGTVIYQLPGQTKWAPLTQKSADLMVGTVIQTKENSQAILKFEDGCKLLIGEMTLFKIQSREDKENKNLFTIKLFGKTFIEVKKDGARNNFKIQTPTALATIRGSKMLVSVGDNLITKVTSAEGTIDVASTYLYKGAVLYVEDNLVTLETADGIKKIALNPETIIPERNGSTKLKPNDRIAIYGLIAEPKTSSFFTGSELASLTVLPPKNSIAAAGTMVVADLVTYTSPSEARFNTLSGNQRFAWTNTSPVYAPTAPPVPVTVKTATIVAPTGTQPTPPAPAPPSIPVDINQASTQQSQQAQAGQASSSGAPTGDQASTSADVPATPAQSNAQAPSAGTTGITTSGEKPSATPPAAVIVVGAPVNSTTNTGTAAFDIQ